MSEASDLAEDVAAQGVLLTSLRKTKAALDAFRALAESSEDTSMQDVVVAKRAAADTLGPGGMNALHVACLQGNAADVELLLGFGADPTAEGDVWERAQPGMVERKKWKAFPLYIAAREEESEGHQAVVEMLLAHAGVDVNQRTTDSGATALYIACEWGNPRVVKVLLACDAIDVNQARTDVAPTTPLYALRDSGITPLYFACAQGHTEIVKMLLARDEIDVNKATDDRGTPLSVACDTGNIETIRILLADGRADVHSTMSDYGGYATLLHITAGNGHLLVAQLLVVYGASLTATVNIRNNGWNNGRTRRTPAQIATMRNHPILAEWLTAVAGWSQLRIAAGCRLHNDAALLLRQGRVDPERLLASPPRAPIPSFAHKASNRFFDAVRFDLGLSGKPGVLARGTCVCATVFGTALT